MSADENPSKTVTTPSSLTWRSALASAIAVAIVSADIIRDSWAIPGVVLAAACLGVIPAEVLSTWIVGRTNGR